MLLEVDSDRTIGGPAMQGEVVAVRTGWICLLLVGLGILLFGAGAAFVGDDPLLRADGWALAGLGLFGTVVTLVPFRRRERWAWLVLWFYPAFWVAHLLGRLPPGKDHVHQGLFLGLSVAGLLVSGRAFWPPAGAPAPPLPRDRGER